MLDLARAKVLTTSVVHFAIIRSNGKLTRHHALAAAVCTMNLVLHPAKYQDFAANQTEMSVQIAS
jgi:hypothetical protein